MEEEDIKKQRDELVARAKNEIDKLKSKIADFEENILPGAKESPGKSFNERIADMREKKSFFPTNINLFWTRLRLSIASAAAFYFSVSMCIILKEKVSQGIYLDAIVCAFFITAYFYIFIREFIGIEKAK